LKSTLITKLMKKRIIKPMEIDGMLYQKTNEDFNKEKPNPQDPTQSKELIVEEKKEGEIKKKQLLSKKK
jgi:hypothetical protein